MVFRVTNLIRFGPARIVIEVNFGAICIATGFPLLPPVVILRLFRQQPRLDLELGEKGEMVDCDLAEHVILLNEG